MTSSPFPGVTYLKAPERSSMSDNAPVETLVGEHLPLLQQAARAVSADWSLWQSRPHHESTAFTTGEGQPHRS